MNKSSLPFSAQLALAAQSQWEFDVLTSVLGHTPTLHSHGPMYANRRRTCRQRIPCLPSLHDLDYYNTSLHVGEVGAYTHPGAVKM